MKVSAWGNYPVVEAEVREFAGVEEARRKIGAARRMIPQGLARSYGDSAIGEAILSTLKNNRVLAFDERRGVVRVESGVSLAELVEIFAPRGWFLPTTPGTKFVTVGGAIASDVHGKNHHVAGNFSRHVVEMDVALADGAVVTCSPEREPNLFHATAGGMGLTGVVLEATIQLQPIETVFIAQETVKAANLDEIMTIFEESASYSNSVAWIDCLAKGASQGRSLMMRGEHAKRDELPERRDPLWLKEKGTIAVPFNFPGFALNSLSIKLFNELYYRKAPSGLDTSIVDLETFYYPLDAVHRWNRIYGKRGFTQYQFVLPKSESREGLKKILGRIAESGQGSFLAVLKLCGKETGLISFPMEGYSLALDFPITRNLFPLLDELDEMVHERGGRIYLTKDVRLSAESFDRGYPNADLFRELKRRYDPDGVFQSRQSKRLRI
ncbi:MAG: FAD-binding protein [Ignavibacteriales bacterium]|nr:FAD-binding protein [Ignavibacteriales bacterium]